MNARTNFLPPRFWSKVDRRSDCWIWTGCIAQTGYGQFHFERKTQSSHRLAYLDAHGTIPDGLHLDHLCRVRACVNPDHLEPVTNRENALRGNATYPENCKNGHKRTEANTRINSKSGVRECRTCQAEGARRNYKRKRELGGVL